jgi:hypothetical protein
MSPNSGKICGTSGDISTDPDALFNRKQVQIKRVYTYGTAVQSTSCSLKITKHTAPHAAKSQSGGMVLLSCYGTFYLRQGCGGQAAAFLWKLRRSKA